LDILTESKVYEYTCTNCGKQIDARKTSAPTRTICRGCVLKLSLNIQNKGTPEHPEIDDIVRGHLIGHKNNNLNIFHACPVCKMPRWVSLRKGKPESDKCNQCKWDGRLKENHPLWVKNRTQYFQGYIQARLPSDNFFYPMADKRGWVFEHRLVMAKSLGRCLHDWEIVHHKNHIKDDNRIENLQLVSDDQHKSLTMMEMKIDRLLTKQDELMTEIKLLRFENKQLRVGVPR